MVFDNQDEKLNWKADLRSALLDSLVNKHDANSKIGYYYMCCAPRFLYKYYNDAPEKLETVKAGKMWYSAPTKFNDVFDCDLTLDDKGIFNSAINMIPNMRGVIPGSQMWYQIKKLTDKGIRDMNCKITELREAIGISCLSESFDSLLMWAHYANNHHGMCVEYELLSINKQLGFSPVPVVYSQNRIRIDSISPDSEQKDAKKSFFMCLTSKSPEWLYEQEWRIIRDQTACGNKWSSEKRGALLDMIKPRSIILGCMASVELERKAREYCEECSINLYKMEKSPTSYQLIKTPILEFNAEE
ncbi:MAG: DUF2971 domain-containing protein [Clostridiales bacterium]|nr:DUF2971 domain-containing protein [Clostridiales bacterium]